MEELYIFAIMGLMMVIVKLIEGDGAAAAFGAIVFVMSFVGLLIG